jgi:glutathione S-transferase
MTPNGLKISIMLEEIGLPYRVHAIAVTKGHQFDPAFLEVSPNNKIPAIVDTDNGLHLMESGAILMYLAEKTGRFLASRFPHQVAGRRVADVADGWNRTLPWSGPSLREVQIRQELLRRRTLCRRSKAAMGVLERLSAVKYVAVTNRLRISRSGPGSRASNGRPWTSPRFRM